jgi:hypothetical protein
VTWRELGRVGFCFGDWAGLDFVRSSGFCSEWACLLMCSLLCVTDTLVRLLVSDGTDGTQIERRDLVRFGEG